MPNGKNVNDKPEGLGAALPYELKPLGSSLFDVLRQSND